MSTGAVIRGLFGCALAFVAVWLIAILYWSSTGAAPTTGQIFGYLLIVPLLLIGGFLLIRMLIRRRKAGDGTQSPAAADGSTVATMADAAQDRVLYVLATAVLTRAGNSGDAIAQSLAQPDRPSLHPILRDQMGLPVFAAPVDDIDLELVRASMAGFLPRSPGLVDAQLRALALLEPVAEELLYAALPPPVEPSEAPLADSGTLHPHAMHHSRSSRAAAPAALAPLLSIRLLLPATWPDPVRRACVGWLSDKAAAIGFAGDSFSVGIEPVTGAADAWRVIDRVCHAESRDGTHESGDHLLLAAYSLVDEMAVDRLDATRALLVSGNPEGLIPGEAAAGVLLSATPQPHDAETPALRLHGIVHGPAGQGRSAGHSLGELMEHTLGIAEVQPKQVGAVFSDADHRPSRSIEIAVAITACLPEIDPFEQGRHLGIACGETGAAATLAVLSAAAAQARADNAPVMVASVADREVRYAALVSPVPNPELSAATAAETA